VTAAVIRLARSIGIEPGEGRVFAWSVATFFLVRAASVALANASDTFFLKRIGVSLLPLVFLASSALLVVTTSAVVRLSARRPQIPLLAQAFFALAVALVPLWLLAIANVRSVFVVLVLISKQVESIAVLVFWVTVGGLLHTRQAKRLYAPIVAGGTVGEIAGSFASGIIGRSLGIAALLPIAAAALALAGLLALRAESLAPLPLAHRRRRQAAAASSGALALFAPLWRESRLFRILSVSALLCGTLGPMLYFQFSYVADLATQGANAELRLLSLYAAFRGWINVAVLILQLLGTARLFRRIGVPLASTLSPLIYLLGFFGISVRLSLDAAVAAMAGASLQDHAVYDPAQKVLVTLFPERQRPAATSLVEGPVLRAGGVLGNLIVLAVIALGQPASVGLVGLPIAALWVAAALALWRIYPTLLLEVMSARRGRTDEGLPLRELLDPATQRALAASLIDPDPHRVRAACGLVAAGPPESAVPALARAAARAPTAHRELLVETLHGVLDRSGETLMAAPGAASALEVLLADPRGTTAATRADLVEAYARLASVRPGSRAAAVLVGFRSDPEEAVRLAATARLYWAGIRGPDERDLDSILTRGAASDDTATRHVALDELRTALLAADQGDHAGDNNGWPARLALLAARLEDPRDCARAAEVLADVAGRGGLPVAAMADLLLPYAGDADPRVRAAVLRFIGAARVVGQVGWVVERLAAGSEAEATAAAAALRSLGSVATNALLDALHRGKRATRSAVLPILRDLHVDAATLRALIDREVAGIQRTRLLRYGLRSGSVSDVLLQRLGERVDEGAHTALMLLAALRNEDRFAVLGRLLARSPRGRGRAVLLEALEALLPPGERARLMPLLDDDDSRAARAAAEALRRSLPAFEEAAREALAEQDALTVAFLTASLDTPPLVATEPMKDTAMAHDDREDTGMLSRVEIVLHLRSLDLFARLTTRQLSEIAAVVREDSFPAGAVIVREGEFGDCMYLIVSGDVQITRQGQYTVGASAGELFGEMSLFDGETRFASVTAIRRVRLLRLDRHDLFDLMEEEPAIAIGICQTLSRHARDSISRLESRLADKKPES